MDITEKTKKLSFLFFLISMATSCSVNKNYPPLEWATADIEALYQVIANTRSDSIRSFSIRSLDQNFNCNALNNRNITDPTDRFALDVIEINRVCSLIHVSEASFVFSDTALGQFVIFKYKDESELAYLADETSLIEDYWKKYFKSAKQINEHWYLNTKELALTLPD